MDKIKKLLVSLLIIAMVVTILPNDLLVEANNTNTVTKSFKDVKKGEELRVYFEGKVPEDKIDLKGLKFIGVKDNYYTFEALQDMKSVTITLSHSKVIDEGFTMHDEGSAIEVIPPSGEAGGVDSSWENYTFGKKYVDGMNYNIYLDFADYSTDGIKPDVIYYRDIPKGGKLKEDTLVVSHLIKDENKHLDNVYIDDGFEIVKEDNHTFTIAICTKSYDGVYIGYSMELLKGADSIENKFQILTKQDTEGESAHGSGRGEVDNTEDDDKNDEVVEEEDPVEEEDEVEKDDTTNEEDDDTEDEQTTEKEQEEEDKKPTPPIIPEKPSLVDVTVYKKWEGEPLEEVEVRLLKDGIEEDTVILNSDNNWTHTFKDLYKYDNLGEEHLYSVEEVTIDSNYATQYKQVDDYEWEIINTFIEKEEEEPTDTEEDIDDEAIIEDIDEDEEAKEEDLNEPIKEIEEDKTDGYVIDEEEEESPIQEDISNIEGEILPKTGERSVYTYIALGLVIIIFALILKTKEN